MAVPQLPPIANVGQATDIVLLAFVLALALVVGLALFGIDTLVGHLRRRQSSRR